MVLGVRGVLLSICLIPACPELTINDPNANASQKCGAGADMAACTVDCKDGSNVTYTCQSNTFTNTGAACPGTMGDRVGTQTVMVFVDSCFLGLVLGCNGSL